MNEGELELYEVDWGKNPPRRRRIRAEDARAACTRICNLYGWVRRGAPLLDARTKGRMCCEMLVTIPSGKFRLLSARIV